MPDLEDQIKAWADTTMAGARGAGVESPAIPMLEPQAPRRWVRPLAAAAVIVALIAIGVVIVGQRGGERVRTGPASTGGTTTSTTLGGLPPQIPFELLTSRPADADREGTLAAAYTSQQLERLWKDADPLAENRAESKPVPDVDFDRQIVVSMVVPVGSCSELTGFVHGSGRAFVAPQFGSTDPECRGGPFTTQYIVALDRSDLVNSPWLEVEAPDGGARPQLRLWASRPWLVTVDLEIQGIPGELKVGDQVKVNVVVNNATGRPLRTSGCGEPFAVGLRRDGRSYVPVQLQCLTHFDIRTGQSVYETTLVATGMSCTNDKTAALIDRCLADGSPPPLEPGEYELVLRTPGGFEATPPRQTIDLVE
ncbi:MAG: hypothetical protein ACTHN0_18430 [Aquihabitans sp.]